MSEPVRVLLLWPGADAATAGNFGVPQLVILASYARAMTGARVEIRDLELERAFGPVSLVSLLAGPDGRGYDVIALSSYSSFDHLKCTALAELARELYPDAVIMVGGYHPSARPLDYVHDGSAFDVCVVGEGERPLVRVIESVAGGAPLRQVVLGPDPIADLDALPPSDWTLLGRYQKVARRFASQAQVYLSRGCPFDCAFCMERAKREVSWRPLSVERALAEVTSLHEFLDLRGWTLYFGDALFGMRKSWRREFLDGLARAGLPVEKYWLLIRVDLIDDEDLRLFGAANCGLGFGLESGDPGQLAIIRKSGRLDTYLDRMSDIAERALVHQVPWGANVICGHPGETPDSMARSAAYLRELFLRSGGTTGFLSVDPFRLYPGSPIDAERAEYEQRYGTRFHRPRWWDDGDPEFLSEWVDPSAELSWLERERLQHALLDPVLAGIEANFAYQGPARGYFLRAIREQVAFTRPPQRLHYLGRYFAWQRYLGRRERSDRERRGHAPLAELCRAQRRAKLAAVAEQADVDPAHPVCAAIVEVPRERFVPSDCVAESVLDRAIALTEGAPEGPDAEPAATLSAMHAYARSFALLDVGPGDWVLDLGAGTGYGAAVLARLVGAAGRVHAVELDPELAELGRANLAELEPASAIATLVCGDAADPRSWACDPRAFAKVSVGFAVAGGEAGLPAAWLAALAPGTMIVAPLEIDGEGRQRLVRATHRGDHFEIEQLEVVHYVRQRRPEQVRPRPQPAPAPEPVEPRPTRLTVLR